MAHEISSRRARPALALALGLAFSTPATGARTPGEVEIGQTLREATIQGLNGPARRLSEFRGKPLIINVWASWCGPCKAEMASLERLSWHDDAKHFRVIGISTDDYPEKAKAYLVSSNATISHYIDQKLLMEHMLGASQIPLTVLVDRDGKVIEKVYGATQWDGPQALALIRKSFGLKGGAAAGGRGR